MFLQNRRPRTKGKQAVSWRSKQKRHEHIHAGLEGLVERGRQLTSSGSRSWMTALTGFTAAARRPARLLPKEPACWTRWLQRGGGGWLTERRRGELVRRDKLVTKDVGRVPCLWRCTGRRGREKGHCCCLPAFVANSSRAVDGREIERAAD